MDTAPKTRVLMKNGEWLVPESERPRGWQNMGVREPLPTPPELPREPQVAATVIDPDPPPTVPLMDQVIEQTVNTKPENCECGKPLRHRGLCSYRAMKCRDTREKRKRMASEFSELAAGVRESATAVGAEHRLLHAALIMIAGLWTRRVEDIRRLLNWEATPRFISSVITRYENSPIWADPHCVHLGIDEEPEEQNGDIGFWLNAMVGTGQIEMTADLKYRAASAK